MIWLFKRHVSINSSINGKITVGTRNGKKALFAGGVTQSGGELIPMWKKAVKILGSIKTNPKEILVLGVAGGTLFPLLTNLFPKAHLTGVDIDQTMIKTAKKYFGVADGKQLDLVVADAIVWCRTDQYKYDFIICDLYLGRFNPASARTKEFLQILKKTLNSNGALIYNCHYDKNNVKEYKNFYKLCEELFKQVKEVYSFPLNRLLLLRK